MPESANDSSRSNARTIPTGCIQLQTTEQIGHIDDCVDLRQTNSLLLVRGVDQHHADNFGTVTAR